MSKENKEETARTKRSAMKTIYACLKLLKENGGSMPRKQLLELMEQTIKFEPWETERYASNGQLKWLTIFLFYTIDSKKAGWLIKNKGAWSITPAGEKALKLGPEQLIDTAAKAYREWRKNQDENEEEVIEKEVIEGTENAREVYLIQVETQAEDGIKQYLEKMPEYDFQHLAAILLQAMGYYINWEAPEGKDGGIDIIAFKDALGFEKPRIKVQVKRFNEHNKVDVKMIREFKSLLHKGEDIGIFITSGYFTKDAEDAARFADIHIKLINREDFIKLWIIHGDKLKSEEKALLPLHPIYFLGSNE